MQTIITFGTFDLFHEGHLSIIKRAREMGDRLVVGVSSDAFNVHKKQKAPIISEKNRMDIVGAIKYVDEVFLEESMELKQHYIDTYKANVLVMGDDWKGSFDLKGCETVYLPRTKGVSTTSIIEGISK